MSFWTWIKVVFCYLFPFWPRCPQIGQYWESDCVFTQSFGRNGFLDKELGTVLDVLRIRSEYDDVKTFDRLQRGGFSVGHPNEKLGRHIYEAFRQNNRTLILQWEVAYGMYLVEPEWYRSVASQKHIVVLWPPKTGYFSTYDVKKASVEEMRKRGLKRPLEVAHPAMIVRAVLILWRLGVNPVVLPEEDDPLWVWDKGSIQPWTRSFFPWLLRELPGRVHHILFRYATFIPPKAE